MLNYRVETIKHNKPRELEALLNDVTRGLEWRLIEIVHTGENLHLVFERISE